MNEKEFTKEKCVKLNFFGQDKEVWLSKCNYMNNNRIAIQTYAESDGCIVPWSVITTNIDSPISDENCAFIDINNAGYDIVDSLVDAGLGEPTGNVGFSGFCCYPEFKLDMNKLNEININMDK